MTQLSTVDAGEVAKFQAMAAEWWDPNGKFKPLHMLNPCRLDYITSQIAAEFDRDLHGAVTERHGRGERAAVPEAQLFEMAQRAAAVA